MILVLTRARGSVSQCRVGEVSWRNVTPGAGSSVLHTCKRFLNTYIFLVMLSCEHSTWMCPNFISFVSFHASSRYFLLV